ncbi:hypothetical protein CDW55_09035 [Chryseobacterium sp. VAUSW3]|nr:hypothetical protein CDW55_09035 [Chryseobacterium sp. VAUSW3]
MGKKIRFLFIFDKRPPVFVEFQYYHFKICFLKNLMKDKEMMVTNIAMKRPSAETVTKHSIGSILPSSDFSIKINR